MYGDRQATICSTTTGCASMSIRTLVPLLGLVVPMGRSTREPSAGTVGSMSKPLSLAAAFMASASGFQRVGSSSSVSGQYTCRPLPECVIKGLGRPICWMNLPVAASPSFHVGNGLLSPQSTSSAITLVARTFSCFRFPFSTNAERAKYVLLPRRSSSITAFASSSTEEKNPCRLPSGLMTVVT